MLFAFPTRAGTLQGVGKVLRQARPNLKIIVAEPALAPLLSSGPVQPAFPLLS